jgi:hypothetical protein
MGDLDVSSYQPIVAALPAAVVALAVFAWLARPLNLLALGPDSAESRGLDVTRRSAARSERVAGDGRRRSRGRPDRLHRHHQSRTWCGCSSARITGSCCRRRALRRRVSRGLRSRRRARFSRRSNCRWASSRP